jgi:hypothetical protein
MGQHLAKLGTLFLVGGCSLIYNPDKLPGDKRDAAPDSPVDANPANVAIDSVFPSKILEGAGTGGSRKALVVLKGHDFLSDGSLAVTFTPSDAVTIDAIDVGEGHDYVALTITAPVNMMKAETDPAQPLAITLTQNGATPVMLDGTQLSLTYLDELTAAPTASPPAGKRYSTVAITSTITVATSTMMKEPLTINSVSSISITPGGSNPAIVANGVGQAAGPGGCAGAAATKSSMCIGGGGGADGTLLAGGGGGGGLWMPGTAGTNGGPGGAMHGTDNLDNLAASTPAGGGGGAAGTAAGGGGGGVVHLVAGGDVTVGGSVAADGGMGGPGNTLKGGGGGGSGGVILMRAGGALSTGPWSVAKGGGGGGNGGPGGPGSDGRMRWDAASLTGTAPSGLNVYIGPQIKDAPYTTRTKTPTIVVAGKPTGTADGRIFDAMNQAGTPFTAAIGTGAPPATGSAMLTLVPGYNKVCVTVAGGDASQPESTNCIEMAYLP